MGDQSLLPPVELSPVTCYYCGATGTCRTCKGTGKWASAALSKTPVSDTCMACKGNGKCPTCEGTGSRQRTRSAFAAPLTTARSGFELCYGCEGTRHCERCSGSGVQDNGKPCDHCYQRGGTCPVCEGEGQIKS